jgi:hypothetical protein
MEYFREVVSYGLYMGNISNIVVPEVVFTLTSIYQLIGCLMALTSYLFIYTRLKPHFVTRQLQDSIESLLKFPLIMSCLAILVLYSL